MMRSALEAVIAGVLAPGARAAVLGRPASRPLLVTRFRDGMRVWAVRR